MVISKIINFSDPKIILKLVPAAIIFPDIQNVANKLIIEPLLSFG